MAETSAGDAAARATKVSFADKGHGVRFDHCFDRTRHVDAYYQRLCRIAKKADAEATENQLGTISRYVMLVVIFLSVVTTALEVELGPGADAPFEDQLLWLILEIVFTVLFLIEIVVGIVIYRAKWIENMWNWLDLFLVVTACTEIIFTLAGLGAESLKMFKLLRGLRLARLMVSKVKSMYVVVIAWWASATGIVQVYVMMVGGLFVYATVATATIGQNKGLSDLDLGGFTVDDKFGTIGRSMYSLFQLMTLEGFEETTRPIVMNQPGFFVFFGSYVVIFSFGLLNLLIGLIVSKIIGETRRLEVDFGMPGLPESVKNLMAVFDACDVKKNDRISLEDLDQAVRGSEEVRRTLERANLPAIDTIDLFNIIDANAYGFITRQEFIVGCCKMYDMGGQVPALAAHAAVRKLSAEMKELLALERQESIVIQGVSKARNEGQAVGIKAREASRVSCETEKMFELSSIGRRKDHSDQVPTEFTMGSVGEDYAAQPLPTLTSALFEEKLKEHIYSPEDVEFMDQNYSTMKEDLCRLSLRFDSVVMQSTDAIKRVLDDSLHQFSLTHMKRTVDQAVRESMGMMTPGMGVSPINGALPGITPAERFVGLEQQIAELRFFAEAPQTYAQLPQTEAPQTYAQLATQPQTYAQLPQTYAQLANQPQTYAHTDPRRSPLPQTRAQLPLTAHSLQLSPNFDQDHFCPSPLEALTASMRPAPVIDQPLEPPQAKPVNQGLRLPEEVGVRQPDDSIRVPAPDKKPTVRISSKWSPRWAAPQPAR